MNTSIESARGCGYRNPGGMYLVSEGLAGGCDRLPIPLEVCPCCNQGIKPARGFTWVSGELIAELEPECEKPTCGSCILSERNILAQGIEKFGLLWIGEKFYKTAHEFSKEAAAMGVSRRISAIPRDFKLGETWVLVAHRKAVPLDGGKWGPGIFRAFKPTAIEYITKGDETPDDLKALEKRGLTPIKLIRDIDLQTSIDDAN